MSAVNNVIIVYEGLPPTYFFLKASTYTTYTYRNSTASEMGRKIDIMDLHMCTLMCNVFNSGVIFGYIRGVGRCTFIHWYTYYLSHVIIYLRLLPM